LINAESAPVKYFLPAKTIDGNNEKIVNRWNIESNVMLFYRFFSSPQTYCQRATGKNMFHCVAVLQRKKANVPGSLSKHYFNVR